MRVKSPQAVDFSTTPAPLCQAPAECVRTSGDRNKPGSALPGTTPGDRVCQAKCLRPRPVAGRSSRDEFRAMRYPKSERASASHALPNLGVVRRSAPFPGPQHRCRETPAFRDAPRLRLPAHRSRSPIAAGNILLQQVQAWMDSEFGLKEQTTVIIDYTVISNTPLWAG